MWKQEILCILLEDQLNQLTFYQKYLPFNFLPTDYLISRLIGAALSPVDSLFLKIFSHLYLIADKWKWEINEEKERAVWHATQVQLICSLQPCLLEITFIYTQTGFPIVLRWRIIRCNVQLWLINSLNLLIKLLAAHFCVGEWWNTENAKQYLMLLETACVLWHW